MERSVAVLVVAMSLGCMGSIDGGARGKQPDPRGGQGGAPGGMDPVVTPPVTPGMMMACKTRDPGPAPIRRLTKWEYDNTIRDLLGDDSHPSAAFPADERGAGFTNDAQSLSVSPLHAQNYMDAAEKIVARAAGGLAKLTPCDPARGDAACGMRFIETWGKRAWRRPPDAYEKGELGKVLAAGMASGGFAAGIQMVMQVMLQAPQFLYRVELAMGPMAGGGAAGSPLVKLSPYEMASRLSYLVLGSLPDSELFLAAEMNKLGTKEELAAQARRLLGDPRAHQTLAIFHEQWLDLAKIEEAEKDPRLFPTFDAPLRALLDREAELFVEEVMWKGDGTVGTLLTAPFSMMNARLAAHYGVKGPTGDAFVKVDLDPTQRAGYLSQAGFLAGHALPNQTDPVRRGKFVREQLFCTIPPPPPDNVEVRPPDLDPNLTTRERFSQHTTDLLCAVCHKLMDPIGLGFENFDAIGRWRATENGKPVDASGEVLLTEDADGPFVGAVALGQRLAGSAQVKACVSKQWFRFGYGRSETPEDLCSLETLKATYLAVGGNTRDLVVALTQTDAFMYRRAGGTP